MDGHIFGLFLYSCNTDSNDLVTSSVFKGFLQFQLARMAEQHALTITSGGDVTTTRSCDKQ